MTITPSTPSNLLSQLASSLGSAMPTTMSTSTPGNDLYEAYLFGLFVGAATSSGYALEIHDEDGPASYLHFRRSPGRLCNGRSKTGHKFSHALISYPGRPALEVHVGVKVVGKSLVTHEADVLVLRSDVASRARVASADPRSAKALLVVEAKYYTNAVTVSTAREFLGLRHDLSAKNMVFVSTSADDTCAALLAGTPALESDDGVLPRLAGEADLTALFSRILKTYRQRR